VSSGGGAIARLRLLACCALAGLAVFRLHGPQARRTRAVLPFKGRRCSVATRGSLRQPSVVLPAGHIGELPAASIFAAAAPCCTWQVMQPACPLHGSRWRLNGAPVPLGAERPGRKRQERVRNGPLSALLPRPLYRGRAKSRPLHHHHWPYHMCTMDIINEPAPASLSCRRENVPCGLRCWPGSPLPALGIFLKGHKSLRKTWGTRMGVEAAMSGCRSRPDSRRRRLPNASCHPCAAQTYRQSSSSVMGRATAYN
jgi:hypothetical protein